MQIKSKNEMENSITRSQKLDDNYLTYNGTGILKNLDYGPTSFSWRTKLLP
jgi:hypothetical protein